MSTKKPERELVACATALLEVSLSDPVGLIEELIDDGYRHLDELKASAKCNPLLVNSLSLRIDKAEAILAEKRKQLVLEQQMRSRSIR